MIAFVVGTTAELIKIAPVFHACERRGSRPLIWFTGQHVDDVAEMLDRLGLPEPTRWLARGVRGRDLERPGDVPRWMRDVVVSFRSSRREMRAELRADGKVPTVLVHGDTFTTVVGSVIGRLLGARVGHIEAGMRSGSLRSPFPEEANRRLVSRLVQLHFAPSEREVTNLRRARGDVVGTSANTVVDSLKLLRGTGSAEPQDLPDQFGVATLHRFELVRDEQALEGVLHVLHRASRTTPIMFFVGASERARIERYGLSHLFDDRLVLRPKLPYLDFLPVLGKASFVVTDSGGLQQECAYLGLPCLVHRERTESHHGLGVNVTLSGLDLSKVEDFLASPERYSTKADLDAFEPSEVIADYLTAKGAL